MQVPVKDIQEGQIIRDASERQVIVEGKTVLFVDGVPHSVILNGILVWDGSPWSTHCNNPEEKFEVVLSESK